MKNIIKLVLIVIFKLIYIFYSYNLQKKIGSIRNILFSYWIRNLFKKCGKEIHLQSPVYVKGGQYMTIGSGFHALDRLRLECWDEFQGEKFSPNLIIGNNVVVNYNVHIGCVNKIIIGNNVLLGSNILIIDHQHGYVDQRDLNVPPTKRFLFSSGSVVIGDNVWIGENVSIMPNTTIGEGCIIGANSVVTKSFPKNSVIAGVPARNVKSLFKK